MSSQLFEALKDSLFNFAKNLRKSKSNFHTPLKKWGLEDSEILLFSFFDNDDIPDDLVDNFYDDIIRHRTIARRTNWRLRFTSLSQREVALNASIASSLSDYVRFVRFFNYVPYCRWRKIQIVKTKQRKLLKQLLSVATEIRFHLIGSLN